MCVCVCVGERVSEQREQTYGANPTDTGLRSGPQSLFPTPLKTYGLIQNEAREGGKPGEDNSTGEGWEPVRRKNG